ncbi:hypothetical protein Nmel_002519 [Mimus melanotis]
MLINCNYSSEEQKPYSVFYTKQSFVCQVKNFI